MNIKLVRNNPDQFPIGYCFNLQFAEKQYVVENFHRFQSLKFSTMEPRAFTEKGLYMLATILKSERATQTTIAIVETFAKLKELSRTVSALSEANEQGQKNLMQKGSELIADLLDDEQKVTDSETTIELNLAVLKVKHTVKRKAEKE
nr:ORF6N domain-containing protein [Parabacteroides bouchesdurhonensis]